MGAAADFDPGWDAQTLAAGTAPAVGLPPAVVIPIQGSNADLAEATIPVQTAAANVVPMRPGVFQQSPVIQPVDLGRDRRRRRFAEWPISVTLAGIVIALVVTVTSSFRAGAAVLGAGLLLAAVFRLVLTDAEAGMLRSRSRPVDLAVICTFAAATLAIAAWIPPPV